MIESYPASALSPQRSKALLKAPRGDLRLTGDERIVLEGTRAAAELLEGIGRAAFRPLLVVGATEVLRSRVLQGLASATGVAVTSVGASLSAELLSRERVDVVAAALRILDDASAVWLLDRIEILFLSSLPMGVLETLLKLCRRRPTCAAWPGWLRDGRLQYARLDHPEHVDEDARRAVVLDLATFESYR